MTDKKLEQKRIGIYILFSYGIAWIVWILTGIGAGDYENWGETTEYSFLGLMIMAAPAIGNILTRLITKEGMENSFLHFSLKGKFKYYLAALFLPVLSGLITGIVSSLVYCGGISLEKINDQAGDPAGFAGYILYSVSACAVISYYAFGEEFGWRAYLYPKLEKLIGLPKTIIAGGIIWGIWHAPLTVMGHNFGQDYPGYPVSGIALMCVFCIFTGGMLAWLTKKTHSVFTASLAHSSINTCSGISFALTAPAVNEMISNNEISMFSFQIFNMLISSALWIIFIVLMLKENNKKI